MEPLGRQAWFQRPPPHGSDLKTSFGHQPLRSWRVTEHRELPEPRASFRTQGSSLYHGKSGLATQVAAAERWLACMSLTQGGKWVQSQSV